MGAQRVDQLLANRPRRAAPEQRAQERAGLHLDDGLRGRHQRREHGRARRIHRHRPQLAHALEPEQLQGLGGGRTAQREVGDHQAPRLRQEQRAFEAEPAQLLADGAHDLGHLGLAPQPGCAGGEHGLVLPGRGQVAQRPQPLPLLPELRGRLVPEAAQGAQERPPGLAIHPQAQRAGALAVEEQGDVRAPQLDRGDLRPHFQRLRDLGRDARQPERLLVGRLDDRRAVGQLAQPFRRLLAARLAGGERTAERGEAQLHAVFAQQVAAHAQLGEQGAADRRRVVDDALEDTRLHVGSVQERTAGVEVPDRGD